MPTLDLVPASTEDYRRLAEATLPRRLFDFVDGGSFSERTLAANVSDFEAIQLKQRVMHDVSNISIETTILGERWSMPIALAPVGLAGMMARRAEVQAVRAANSSGIPFSLSTVGICSIEEVAKASDKPAWFQLYMLRDRSKVKELLARAKGNGVNTLVFTVDLAMAGARYRDVRNGMAGGGPWVQLRSGLISYLLHPGWLWHVGIRGRPHGFGNLAEYVPRATNPADFREWVQDQFDPSVTWRDIEWLRTVWDGHLVIKGILSPQDAAEAAQAGADAIIVSNHGGRQLDGVSSSIKMLPCVAEAVGDTVTILLDGGVRSGQDVIKAVALGAKGVLIGRPWVYAVAARGEKGVRSLLETMRDEMKISMALTGKKDIAEITSDLIE